MTMLSYDMKGNTAKIVMKILSNSNRYNLMKLLLSTKRDLCVNELSENVGISQSATSHQLSYLEARGVVKSIRMGKKKCYLPADAPLTKKIKKVIDSLK